MVNDVEILAPAGSPESFLAAIEGGANAVYLGLKSFNARGNAINFTPEELSHYVPLAHERGTRVYLTLNTLVKMQEMGPLLRELDAAAACGIDGVILQDIGLGRTIAKYYPHLRRHASTQMAIHNLDGVRFCVDEGFERVVLARELTVGEIKDIRAAFPSDVIELEVFCHGAMCYTYSGMCFFSGSVGGRSGNRGECAYTCRKGYRIHNETAFPMAAEPGSFNNYLFSMKDMNTLDLLPELVGSGVDSLKIEGRRKGPAYVSASVQAYRGRLDGLQTDDLERDMQLAFGREYTKAFYPRAQYGDAPIDVTATGASGVEIGVIEADGSFILREQGVQRYDGLRLVRPNRTEVRTAFKDYSVDQGDPMHPQTGVRIKLAEPQPVGTRVMWVRSQEVERRYKPPKSLFQHAPGKGPVTVNMRVQQVEGGLLVTAFCPYGHVSEQLDVEASRSGREAPLKEMLFRFGDTSFQAGVWDGPESLPVFAPPSQLKKLRRRLLAALQERAAEGRETALNRMVAEATQTNPVAPQPGDDRLIMRVDQLSLLSEMLPYATEKGYDIDFVMRPTLSTPDWKACLALLDDFQGAIRMVLPMVLRKWDVRVIRARMSHLEDKSWDFVISNPGHLPFLREHRIAKTRIHTDFSVYHLSTWAWEALGNSGVDGRFTLSLEDDRPNMEALLAATDPSRFEVTAYTDTPLFIAEACSLAALYGGCPGAKICGHETLNIENEHGDRFQVRHDRCRSTVIGDKALSWSGSLDWFRSRGVHHFRADFTTRDYDMPAVRRIMEALECDRELSHTHSENLDRILL